MPTRKESRRKGIKEKPKQASGMLGGSFLQSEKSPLQTCKFQKGNYCSNPGDNAKNQPSKVTGVSLLILLGIERGRARKREGIAPTSKSARLWSKKKNHKGAVQ